MTIGDGQAAASEFTSRSQLLGDRLEFASLVDLARTAQRGLFDFLAVDDDLTVLSALAGTCERLGLVGTVDTAVDATLRRGKAIGDAGPSLRRSGGLERRRQRQPRTPSGTGSSSRSSARSWTAGNPAPSTADD